MTRRAERSARKIEVPLLADRKSGHKGDDRQIVFDPSKVTNTGEPPP